MLIAVLIFSWIAAGSSAAMLGFWFDNRERTRLMQKQINTLYERQEAHHRELLHHTRPASVPYSEASVSAEKRASMRPAARARLQRGY